MNSKKKCTDCGKYYDSSTGVKVPVGGFCDFACIHNYTKAAKSRRIKKSLEKIRDPKFNKQSKKDLKAANDNDESHQRGLTQIEFNAMVVADRKLWYRIRGLEPICISCAKPNMDWACGHFKTVGAHPELRFDERNVELQCNMYCNKNLSGNIAGNKSTRGYIQGILDTYGERKQIERLEYLNSPHPRNIWSDCEELRRMRKEFAKRKRELRKKLESYE